MSVEEHEENLWNIPLSKRKAELLDADWGHDEEIELNKGDARAIAVNSEMSTNSAND